MNANNEKYLNELKEKYSEEYGILEFSKIKINLDTKDVEIPNILTTTEFIKQYNLTFFNESKIKNNYIILKHFINYSYLGPLTKKETDINLLAFYIGINKNPFKIIFDLLYSKFKSIELIAVSNIFINKKFLNITFNLIKKYSRNNYMYFDKSDKYFLDKDSDIVSIFEKAIAKNKFLEYECYEKTIKEILTNIKNKNLSHSPIDEEDINENDKFQNKIETKIDVDLFELIFGKENASKVKKNIDDFLDIFTMEGSFNPDIPFLKKMKDKYGKYIDAMLNELGQYDKCRIVKTILFLQAYLTKDYNGYYPSQRMYNITNVDTRWATGTEETYDPSFYGKSKAAKAFSTYYAFMNGERNPYYQIINNNRYDYMDEEALKMHKFFRENLNSSLMYDLLYEQKIVGGKSLYEIISSISEVLDILESPIIGSTGNLLSEIIGLVTSMLNSITQILDFSLSMTAKMFFYIKFIPIGENKFSVSDIYNYLIFLKLILENAQGKQIISNISREEFVSYAYQVLGIRENDIKKIAYCTYDYEMNDKSGLNLYIEKLAKNKYGEPYTARTDLKILYATIQFALMKQVYISGHEEIYKNFDFSNIRNIRKLLNSLEPIEKYYIFKIHYADFYKLEKINTNSIEDIYKFESELRNINTAYNTKSISFYKSFIDIENFANKNHSSMADEYEFRYFIKNTFYNNFLNTELKEYEQKVKANKRNIDKIIFSVNNISDFDDFLMRFLPSIIEVLKLLNIEVDTIDELVKFLDMICYFISDLMFRNLFVKIKFELLDQIKFFEKNIFNEFADNKYIFRLNLNGDSINKRLKKILDEMDYLVLYGSDYRECFKDVYTNIEDENYYLDVDGQHKEKIKIHYYDKNKEYIKTEEGYVESDIESDKNKVIDITNIKEIINKEKNKKLVYENEEIYIVSPDGEKVKIVYKNDKNDSSTIIKTKPNEEAKGENSGVNKPNKITTPIVTENEYDILIQIRDFISNIKNKDAILIINKINEVNKLIEKEQNKKLPNNNIIKKLEENKAKLTEELYYVKNKNNVYVSNMNISQSKNNNSEITGSDFQITISDNYNGVDTAIEKKELLEEVQNVVYENNIPLTNFEIIQLLK